MSNNNYESEQTKLLASEDGAAQAIAKGQYTEWEISEDRESMLRLLDATYLNLLDNVEEFQAAWENNPKLALYVAWSEGRSAGLKEWIGDQGELFKKETWENLGSIMWEWGGKTADRLYSHAKGTHERLAKAYTTVKDNPEGTIKNWAWWQTLVRDAIDNEIEEKRRQVQTTIETISNVVDEAEDLVRRAQMIYKYREEICKIPELISHGDGAAIIAFIKGPLHDIDPEFSEAILKNPDLHYAIAAIEDHDTILTYLSYITLMFDAIPPNFYVYTVGKGSTYLILEIVLNIVLGILTDGAFIAARVGMLMARFAAVSGRTANVVRKLQKATEAIRAFERYINDLLEGGIRLRELGAKLHYARAKNLNIKGNTKDTLQARRANLKRDVKCKCCSSTAHTSPRWAGQSILVYR